jgi:hypothetical protein
VIEYSIILPHGGKSPLFRIISISGVHGEKRPPSFNQQVPGWIPRRPEDYPSKDQKLNNFIKLTSRVKLYI